uniref:Uncharacterized protein n=1 Tax=Eutreptiella gymnastica TaxID=73025 RepID=A0A7S4CVP5_9EUGL
MKAVKGRCGPSQVPGGTRILFVPPRGASTNATSWPTPPFYGSEIAVQNRCAGAKRGQNTCPPDYGVLHWLCCAQDRAGGVCGIKGGAADDVENKCWRHMAESANSLSQLQCKLEAALFQETEVQV